MKPNSFVTINVTRRLCNRGPILHHIPLHTHLDHQKSGHQNYYEMKYPFWAMAWLTTTEFLLKTRENAYLPVGRYSRMTK